MCTTRGGKNLVFGGRGRSVFGEAEEELGWEAEGSAEVTELAAEEEAKAANELEVGIGGGAGMEVTRASLLSGRNTSEEGASRFKEAEGTTSMTRSEDGVVAEVIIKEEK